MGRNMFSALRTTGARAATRRFQTSAVNRANCVVPGEAATTDHAVHATADWKKYSMYGAGFVSIVAVLEFFVHMSHVPHEDNTVYPFRRIRNKPFPWGDGQHSLFGANIDNETPPKASVSDLQVIGGTV